MNTHPTPIQKAISAVGGTTALARLISTPARRVRHSTIHKWLKSRVPAEYVLAIETATGISRHELRPDVFGVKD